MMERRACCSMLMLFVSAVMCTSLVGHMRNKNNLINKLKTDFELLEIAKRQIDQSLKQFDLQLQQMMKQTDDTKEEVKNLQDEIKQLVPDQKKRAKEVEECQNSVVTLNEDIAALEKDRSDNEANVAALRSKWSDITKDLEKQLREFSPLCAYVRKGSNAGGQCPQTAMKNVFQGGHKQF